VSKFSRVGLRNSTKVGRKHGRKESPSGADCRVDLRVVMYGESLNIAVCKATGLAALPVQLH
jgi:hypothetical protein